MISEMGMDQMQTLIMDACDTFSSIVPIPSVFVQSSILFPTPQPLSSPASTSSLTPKMDCVRSVVPFTGFMTFARPLKNLDTHTSLTTFLGFI